MVAQSVSPDRAARVGRRGLYLVSTLAWSPVSCVLCRRGLRVASVSLCRRAGHVVRSTRACRSTLGPQSHTASDCFPMCPPQSRGRSLSTIPPHRSRFNHSRATPRGGGLTVEPLSPCSVLVWFPRGVRSHSPRTSLPHPKQGCLVSSFDWYRLRACIA